ncbi:MAG: hypothetical protein Fur006_68930 [Coleofasciculaceae cyanobacterium]
MSQATQLIYPTVDLFLYDLGDGLGQSSDQINHNRRRFWQRIYNRSLDEKELAESQAQEATFSNYIELLGTNKIERFKYPLDGYYYPVKLGDTYAVQIDCSGKENDPDWMQLPQTEQLRQLKEIVLEHKQQLPGEMGEDWLVWAKLATPNQDPLVTAQDCYSVLQIVSQPRWQRDCKGQETFQGATLFELEQPDITPDGLNRHHHILICLFPHDKTDNELKQIIGRLYRDVIRLFHYRNKVLWVYEQSRQLKNTLKDSSGIVQKLVDLLPQRLSNSPLNLNQLQHDLAHALSISHHYQINLGYLQEQASTVEINAKNYKNRLQTLAQLDANSDLTFLDGFSELATENYLNHIQTDYQILSAGLKPLETLIKTIEGIIEIEKTKNDRTLNHTVAIASVGIGTASLAASTLTEQAEGIVKGIFPIPANQPTPALNYWMSFGLAFVLSVVIGIASAAITGRMLRKGRK